MREILFRGKGPETGIWYDGQYIHLHKTTYCFAEDYEDLSGNDIHQIVFERMTDWGLPNRHLRADVDPSTVGQYIGLTDKNGVKIFEGDIIHVIGPNSNGNYEVKFKYGQFCVGINMPIAYVRDSCEVIGNIHDNKSLLDNQEAGE